jgi:tetratricopeptide (TPR) repeat protein
MKTPWTLRKTDAIELATGLLLFTEDAAELLNLCVAVGSNAASPTIHTVAGGFVVRLAQPLVQVIPGAIRLRQLTANLFLPVDAALCPGLFPDEAAALVRQRGLIFLPGGRILAFAPDQPVALDRLLRARRLPDSAWRPLPAAAALAERLTEILLERPAETPDAVLSQGGEDIGVEEPQPPEAEGGPESTAGENFKKKLGDGMNWLGQKLGWKSLADKGREMADAARQRAKERQPQPISERTRDQQEAALRELLRKFQEGKLEDALRRALPLGEEGGRGGQPTNSAELPINNTKWSLGGVLGGGRGPAGLWMGGVDLQAQLAAEYRKAAEAATAHGDYHRAAFIYAKLLRDYRLAADVLSRGGLHHDAAILYLDKVGDVLAAARAFEAAGEGDRAVGLYRQRRAHIQAGDLLRKMGEEEQARQEYRLAVELMRHNQQPHSAGELALQKLRDSELAEDCFREGWGQRPRNTAMTCLLRLAQLLANHPTTVELWGLVDEAEPFLTQQGTENDAATFFNELVRLGDRPHLASSRDALRDRALLGLAARLRQRAGVETRSGNLVSMLLAQSNLWSAAQVSDAESAVKSALQTRKVEKKPAGRRVVRQLRIHSGAVTAACIAADRGKLFLAFEDGALRCFNPASGGTLVLGSFAQSLHSLVTDRLGEMVVGIGSMRVKGDIMVGYHSIDLPMDSEPFVVRALVDLENPRLSPLVQHGHDPVVVVWDQRHADIERGHMLLGVQRTPLPEFPPHSVSEYMDPPGILGVLPVVVDGVVNLLIFDECNATLCLPGSDRSPGAPLGWIAQPAEGSLSSQVFWSSAQGERLHVEIVRVGHIGGYIYWSRLCVSGRTVEAAAAAVSKTHGYLAAALVVPKQIVAIREGGIDFLRINGRQLQVASTTEINLSGAVGCFFSPTTSEVLVVCRDGYLVRVSVPQ